MYVPVPISNLNHTNEGRKEKQKDRRKRRKRRRKEEKKEKQPLPSETSETESILRVWDYFGKSVLFKDELIFFFWICFLAHILPPYPSLVLCVYLFLTGYYSAALG